MKYDKVAAKLTKEREVLLAPGDRGDLCRRFAATIAKAAEKFSQFFFEHRLDGGAARICRSVPAF